MTSAAPPAARPLGWQPRRLAARVAGQAALAWLVAVATGCEREAPGPDECVAFAEVWLRAQGYVPPPVSTPDDPFQELVRTCLTEPYDRALVECVTGGRNPQLCRVEYARRAEARRDERRR